jgi:hypothetical protein
MPIGLRELAKRGIVSRDRLLDLLNETPVSEEARDRIRDYVASDFGAQKVLAGEALSDPPGLLASLSQLTWRVAATEQAADTRAEILFPLPLPPP